MLNSMKDKEATKAAKFKDKRSFIMNDGRWELYGADMSAMRDQVFERDKWRCVVKGCKTPMEWLQLDHIIPRGKGRDDREKNLRCVCINDHARKHARVRFGKAKDQE